MVKQNFSHYQENLADFCQRWNVTEVALFGSVLKDDFRPDNVIEVLVTFNEAARWSHFDLINMQNELEQIFSQKVELVERSALDKSQNAIRRKHILSNTEVIYVE
jgi:predicted nucleotidyltransferase